MSLSPLLRRAALALTLGAAPVAALAHPHVFIDVDLEALVDHENRLTGVRVVWTYDEFYSLSMISDGGLDADGDGVPEAERLRAFAGKDVDWAAGFPGHLTVTQGGAEAALAPPIHEMPRYVDGRIVTSHIRPLRTPLAPRTGAPVTLRAYDPEYFVAYDTPRLPKVVGATGCTVSRHKPKPDRAQSDLLAELSKLDMTADSIQVMSMADVGIRFADSFDVTCAAR